MKKLFVLLVFAFVAFATNAQTVNESMGGKTYAAWNTDYLVTNTTTRTFIIEAGNDFTSKQDFLFQLDSVSGNHTNVAVTLYGAKFATSAYSAIGSAVNWKGTTADTTIVISNASATLWRYFKITVIGTGTGVSKVDSHEAKLWQQ